MNENKKVKVKLKYKNILLFGLIFFLLLFLIIYIVTRPITNIYIKGNTFLSDWDIIKLSSLDSYPKNIKASSLIIKKKLEKNDMIIKAKVRKKSLTKVYIEIEENRPLFYDQNLNKVIMKDGKKLDNTFQVPYLVNNIPEDIYEKFSKKMVDVDTEILSRISEIEYQPNEVDKERFYLSMSDGNYVYINIKNFDSINNYISMLKQLGNKKGILYLDSGEYFEVR